MKYKYSGGYSEDDIGFGGNGWVYCFKVDGVNGDFQTKIKIGYLWMDWDNLKLFMEGKSFKSIDEIQSVIKSGVLKYKKEWGKEGYYNNVR